MIILVEERVVVCVRGKRVKVEGYMGRGLNDASIPSGRREKREERKEKGKTQTSCENVPPVLSRISCFFHVQS